MFKKIVMLIGLVILIFVLFISIFLFYDRVVGYVP